MWIERLMAGISHQHVLSYNPDIMKKEILLVGLGICGDMV